MNPLGERAVTKGKAAIAENADPSRTGEAIRRVVELIGGWIGLSQDKPY